MKALLFSPVIIALTCLAVQVNGQTFVGKTNNISLSFEPSNPVIAWYNPAEPSAKTSLKDFTLNAEITSKSKVNKIELLHNDVVSTIKPLNNPSQLGYEVVLSRIIQLEEGFNSIKLEIYNDEGGKTTSTRGITYHSNQINQFIAYNDPNNKGRITPEADNFVSDVDMNLPKTVMSNPNAIAVVIGNKDYTKTKPVDFAINDARSIKKYLTEVMGFKEGNILYEENATKGDFETLFGNASNHQARLANTIKKGVSDVFVFYSGHGAPGLNDKKGYFVPVECDPNYVEIGGYSIDVFYQNLSKLNARSVTVVMDACFSGASVFKNISPIVIKSTVPTNTIKDGVVISSSSGDEVSSWHLDQKHGLFTYFFLKAIQDREVSDKDKDGNLTFEELYDYIADNNEGVPYWARRMHGIRQNPTFQNNIKNKVFITYAK